MSRADAVSAGRRWRLRVAAASLAVLGLAASRPGAATATPRRIVVTGSIQAAIDAARPGDTVYVPPGVYVGAVAVNTSGITLEGPPSAVIDAAGATNAISIGTGRITRPPDGPPRCPPLTLHDVAVRGLTVRNATRNGVVLRGVDGFRITGGRYTGNGQYGIFPICSRGGVIEANRVDGSDDSGIYVGDDDDISVRANHVWDNTVGIEIENSTHIAAVANHVVSNTTGILVVVLPNLPVASTEDMVVARNVVRANNRPNPAAPEDLIGQLPVGSGIVNAGGDRVVVQRNVVTANATIGLALLASPVAHLDPRTDPGPDEARVADNVIVGNGGDPDTARNGGRPGADLTYDGSGTGNCFGHNVVRHELPEGITTRFRCP